MRKRPLCLLACILILWIFGMNLAGEMKKDPLPNHFKDQNIRIRGQIYKQERKTSQNIYLKNNSIIVNDQIQSYHSNILVFTKEDTTYQVGDYVDVYGTCREIEQAANPGQFDMSDWYMAQNIHMMISDGKLSLYKKADHSFLSGLLQVRQTLEEVFYEIGEEDAPLICSMVLGEKNHLDQEIKDLYQISGISHILAISGLHISMIGIFLYGMLRRIGGTISISGFIASLILFAYCMMTGMSIATLRAFIMFFVYLSAQILGRTYDLKSALSLALILMLIENPFLLFQGGFQLSVLAVAGMVYVYPVVSKIGIVPSKILQSLCMGLSIQIAVFPCILYHYYSFAWTGIFLNLIVLPCMSFVLMFGMISGVAGIFSEYAGIFLFAPCHYILKLYEILCVWSLKMPGSIQIWGRPTGQSIVLYYTILGLVLLLWNTWEEGKDRKKKILLGILALAVAITGLKVRERKELEITFLDVGQGDAIFWETSLGASFLCDAGSSSEKSIGKYCVIPFLKSKGISKLDYVFMTHMDEDHINGIEEMIQNCDNGILVKTLVAADTQKNEKRFLEIQKLAEDKGIEILFIHDGMTLRAGNLIMKCLAPEKNHSFKEKNENSMVLELEYGLFSALFTGDIEGEGEKRLLSRKDLKKISVLKAAHHGSRNSTSKEFLNKIKPDIAIISCGKKNFYGHPHWQTLLRLEEAHTKIWKTTDSGAVTIKTDGKKYFLEKFKKNFQ